MTSTNKRSIRNYDIWRVVIKRNALFPRTLDATIERQKRGDDAETSTHSIWAAHRKDQQYKESTKVEFQSILIKVVYCLIDDDQLENYGYYDATRELQNLLQPGQPLVDIEVFIQRVMDTSDVCKKRLQATINYYTNSMNLPRYYIPSNVELPSDKRKRLAKERNKTIVLRDDFIEPISEYIEKELRHANCHTNPSLMRAAIAFNIIKGTGLRITNAYQIPVADLEQILSKGEHKVCNLRLKHSKTDFSYVTCKDKRALRVALEMYKKCPADMLNKISSKSPTRFQDFNNLVSAVFGPDVDVEFRSTMIRNFVADTMLNRGLTLTKASKLMNHKSVSATKHYINKYHPGASLLEYEDDDDDEEEHLINV
ncbi:vlf-1 [Spodoptera frugiperda granulovirus]|uniref:Vlf-1 n=1 Tax=Spodoptera frugiperda granulovirus TaxID=307454 RepID=A0A0C5AQ93_9BBAC|nr:vlf-1 [Spodoptera frugiperda granulovirus]AJK91766.1 vlf-1 [Spodoptera frugiperda granulovirus]AXS01129.1 vlf-1 [Spodoptera frugiperda granulovirus]